MRASALPGLAVDPASARAGESVRVTGTEHPAACALAGVTSIAILWEDGTELTTVDAVGADGSFSARVRIPRSAHTGARALRSVCALTGADELVRPTLAAGTVTVVRPPATIATSSAPPRRATVRGTHIVRRTAPVPGQRRERVRGAEGPEPVATRAPSVDDRNAPQPTAPPVVGHVRSLLPASLRAPADVPFDPRSIAASFAIALVLLLLLGFPAELFNSTLNENYDEVSGWFSFLGRWRARIASLPHLPRAAGLWLFLAVAAFLYSLLDPSFGMNRSSAALVLGMFFGLVVSTLAFELPVQMWFRRCGVRGRVRPLLYGGPISIVCVLISRVLNFRPGYLYGLLAAFQPEDGEVSVEDDGRANALGSLVLFAVSITAWFAWQNVDRAAESGAAGFALLVLDATLAGIVIGGIQGVVFGLIPLRFCPGGFVRAWSRTVWAVLFTAGLFAFVHVIIAAGDEVAEPTTSAGAVARASTLFIVFAAVSVGFWAYFRFRRPRAEDAAPDVPAQRAA